MIQRYDIYYKRCAIDKKNNGDYVLYADAEKWVGEEVAALKEELKLNASMLAKQCDLAREAETEIAAWHEVFGTTQLSHASESFRRLNEEIAALKEKLESHAWEVSPAMAEAKIWLKKARELLK